jgi:L-iditol 2-dehydrogenase
MKALVKEGKSLTVKTWPTPSIQSNDDVLIRVVVAGICRTDIYVAQGSIQSQDPIIPGHEFSGTVEALGKNVTHLKIGDRVAVMPVIACKTCQECLANHPSNCLSSKMLGIDLNGAFAEFVIIPKESVYPINDNISFQLAAYCEPIAAALAVLKADIHPKQKGLIYGENRISLLIKKILQAKGFQNIQNFAPSNNLLSLKANSYDYVIETLATSKTLSEMINLVKYRGKIILKSRQHKSIAIDFIAAIKKEITFQAVNYGLFDEATELITNNKVDFTSMFGKVYKLEDFKEAFNLSANDELLKRFFSLFS